MVVVLVLAVLSAIRMWKGREDVKQANAVNDKSLAVSGRAESLQEHCTAMQGRYEAGLARVDALHERSESQLAREIKLLERQVTLFDRIEALVRHLEKQDRGGSTTDEEPTP